MARLAVGRRWSDVRPPPATVSTTPKRDFAHTPPAAPPTTPAAASASTRPVTSSPAAPWPLRRSLFARSLPLGSESPRDRPVRVLGVETSCDDTALALLDSTGRVLAQAAASQWHLFDRFQGVQPLMAASAHAGQIDGVFAEVLRQAKLSVDEIDGVAVTAGPGMAPCLKVGLRWAGELARAHRLPFVGVHHMQAHAMVTELDHALDDTFLALLISGGHTELWLVEQASGRTTILAHTVDDAIGEAFDKGARVIGLTRDRDAAAPMTSSGETAGTPPSSSPSTPFRGPSPGAALEAAARLPVHTIHPFPELAQSNLEFSFAGLKTALQKKVFEMKVKVAKEQAGEGAAALPDKLGNQEIKQMVRGFKQDLFKDVDASVPGRPSSADPSAASPPAISLPPLPLQSQVDLSFSFQRALLSQLVSRTVLAVRFVRSTRPELKVRQLVVAGGVACNQAVRSALQEAMSPYHVRVHSPRPLHCMDNGIMIAALGLRLLQAGHQDEYDVCFHTRWPIGDKIDLHRVKDAQATKEGTNLFEVDQQPTDRRHPTKSDRQTDRPRDT